MTDQALTYVEIDIDFCSLTYGVSPCTASLTASPPTGTIKCFNSLATCQDRENFTNEPVTLRFAKPADYLPASIEAIPSIIDVDLTPGTISLGENLGQRSTVRVSFKDHRWSDTGQGFDKYVSERPYDPYTQGTFWGKFRARQPFLRGRPFRLIRGFVGEAIGSMETRHYVIESFNGPTPDGVYTIVANDVLKLADGDRSKAPLLSNGFLTSDIAVDATGATLSPAGIGDLEYPASGYAAIGGKEIVAFTRSADVLTFETTDSPALDGRAQLGTEAQEHSAQDRVQIVLRYAGQDPGDIIADLLENYAGVDSSYIPIGDWNTETDTYLQRLYTGTIAEPTSVNELISELIEQAALAVWWSDQVQQIRLQVLRAISVDVDRFTDENILVDTLETKEQPDKRISRVWTYFAQRNPLEPQDDPDNYRSSAETMDDDAETDYGTPAIKEIFSRWIPVGGRTTATRLNNLQLGRFRDPPRHFKWQVIRTKAGIIVPMLGSGYRIEAWPIQDVTGDLTNAPIQVTRVRPDASLFDVEAEEMLFSDLDDQVSLNERIIIFDASVNNVNLRTVHDSLFPAPTEGDVTSPPTVVVIAYINTGVTIGSDNTASRAFDVGTWPTGYPLTLVVNGRIQGAGGDGGDGGPASGGNGDDGGAGGVAFYTRQAIDVQVASTGEIFGGGGGGGGGPVGGPLVGDGGGGGAGTVPGAGGSGTSSTGGTDGDPGTANAGGADGGDGVQSGFGGDPGEDGDAGNGTSGGSAGSAIDGISFVTLSGPSPSDIRGPQVN